MNPTVADRYRLLDRLGSGGSGTVWRAQDLVLGRPVAVKGVRLHTGVPAAEEAQARARAGREARAAARLSHPAVVRVYDVVDEGEVVWLVMELVEAPSLRAAVLSGGPLTPGAAAVLGLSLLGALEAAHAAGIVHRDVKPANVLVPEEGTPKLTDFGIASLAGDVTVTATGLILGSPSYMAPEQATSAGSGPAADLWGLGATLYFAVEGVPPFDRGEPLSTLTSVLQDPPRPAVRAGPLNPVLSGLLEKDPQRRLPHAEARELLAGAAGQPAGAGQPAAGASPALGAATGVPPAPAGQVGRPRRSGHAAAAVLAVLVLLVTAVLARATVLRLTADDPPAEQQTEPAPAQEPTAERAPDAWEVFAIGDTPATVAYPPGWEVVPREGTITDLVDPEGGRMLRTDWTDSPREDPVAAWRELSERLAGSREAYEELRIEPVDVRGLPAALWEYRYRRDGADRHAYNLGIAGSDHGWALNLVVDAELWDESQPLWEEVVESFDPGQTE